MNVIPVTLAETIKRMKEEITHDSLAGQVPANCTSFGELHDYVDANEYGGLCLGSVLDPLIQHFGGRDSDEGMPDGLMSYMNQAQDAVHTWLKSGGLIASRQSSLLKRKGNQD